MKEEFCICDLWAAEAYLTALDAPEPTLLEMLDQGIKVHAWLLGKVKERFPTEADIYDYKHAKQNVHSLNYGVEPRKMQQESQLPLHICEWIYDFYHRTFPRIRQRQIRIRNELLETRSITSILGRRKIFFSQVNQEMLNKAYAWPSQSAIGEITLIALTKVFWLGRSSSRLGLPWVFPSLNTHDGFATRCEINRRDEVKKIIKNAFNIPLVKNNLTVRIPIEVGFASNFNDVKDKEVLRYET